MDFFPFFFFFSPHFQVIQVGHDYQAQVPEGLSKYGDAPGELIYLFFFFFSAYVAYFRH